MFLPDKNWCCDDDSENFIAVKQAEGNVVHATHAELATHIGSAREVVSRRLDAMAKRGLVRLDRGLVTLINPAALQGFATEN